MGKFRIPNKTAKAATKHIHYPLSIQLSGLIKILILALIPFHAGLNWQQEPSPSLQTEVCLEIRRLVPIRGGIDIPQPHIYWDPQTMLQNYFDRVTQVEVYTEFLSRCIVET